MQKGNKGYLVEVSPGCLCAHGLTVNPLTTLPSEPNQFVKYRPKFYENVFQFRSLQLACYPLHKFIFIDEMQPITHLSIQLWKQTKHFNFKN